jgi:serine/threonine protein kinase
MWTLTGTLQYRAPETFTIGYGEKIDIWSVGILMYELLVGEVPFQSNY